MTRHDIWRFPDARFERVMTSRDVIVFAPDWWVMNGR
jgi:hypothetical protein